MIKIIKNIVICFCIVLLSSCSIDEIPRQPLLATPLGLKVKTAPAQGGGTGLALFFTANNPEIYFTGYALYISTRIEDFTSFADAGEVFFPLKPTDVPGSQAQLLKNFITANDENLTIYVGGAMSFPERRFYPPSPDYLSITPNSSPADPTFTVTGFKDLPDGTPFISGTVYYFAVYAYSAVDTSYSLPSNITTINFP